MKRAIVLVATALILTASQAMAEGFTPPRHANETLGFQVPWCYCTCLDYCCPKCPEDETEGAENHPRKARTANRNSSTIPTATHLSALPRSARCER